MRPSLMRPFVRRASIAAVIVAGLGLGLSYAFVSRHSGSSRPELSDVLNALGERGMRPVEGRLAGFPYGDPPSETRGESEPAPPDIRIAVARIEKRASADDSPASGAALGAAYAAIGDWDRGIAALEDAEEREPGNAIFLNDLSVLYLERARRLERPEDVPRGLALAERAIKASSSAIEPYFNRALALESLHLREDATRAWGAYMARETDPRWRSAAQRRTSVLPLPPVEAWATARPRLTAALGQAATRAAAEVELYDRYAQPVREDVDNVLLPGWAGDVLAGRMSDASGQLSMARTLAEGLARKGGDPMGVEGVKVIDAAIARGDRHLVVRLAEAHRAYALGNRLYLENKIHQAVAELVKAAAVFRASGSPYDLWTQAYQALDLRADRKPAEALRLLQSGDLARRRHRYGVLDGRVAWFEGVIAGEMGRPDEAVAHFRRALASFQAVGERGYAADAEGLIGDQLSYLGQTAEAWSFNLRAIDHYQRARGRHSRVPMTSSTFLALANGLPEAALYFQDVVVRLATATQQVVQPEAFLFRARVRAVLGLADAAWADIDDARRALQRIEDPGMKQRVQAELEWIRAEADAALATRRSPEAAGEALQFFRGVGFPFETVRVLRTSAGLRLAASDLGSAESELQTAIDAFERQRSSMTDESLRVTSFEEGALAFEDMVRLQALHRARWDTGFRYAERGRAMSFRSLAARAGATMIDQESARRRLPAGLVVLYYVTLDDRLLVFTLSNSDFAWTERRIGRGELARQVRRLRSKAADAGTERRNLLLRQLHDELIGPVPSSIPSHAVIAIVPDGPLNDVPFGALLQASGRYLVEDHAIVVAPSLTVLLGATESWGRSSSRLRRALVVSPSATNDGGRQLPRLPEAQAEAVTIAADYPHATVLAGSEATRSAFESAVNGADVIHFAGHAVANLRYPLLSRLLFTPRGTETGALSVFDLERLPLSHARVVTLAACEAAGGAFVRGEGTLSLARPWLRAGASSVIASVWDIDDGGARRLFTGLHERIAAGIHPAAALQQVQARSAHDGSIAFRDWAGLTAFGAAPE